jgi:hypothetical protein
LQEQLKRAWQGWRAWRREEGRLPGCRPTKRVIASIGRMRFQKGQCTMGLRVSPGMWYEDSLS